MQMHYSVHEETMEEVSLGSKVVENTVTDSIYEKISPTSQIETTKHVWDRTQIPKKYERYALPELK